MKTAAIYARVSSAKQKEENTIASQTAALIAFAAEQGCSVPAEWIFEDEGYSGASLVRPGLERVRECHCRLLSRGCTQIAVAGGVVIERSNPRQPPCHLPCAERYACFRRYLSLGWAKRNPSPPGPAGQPQRSLPERAYPLERAAIGGPYRSSV